MIQSIPTPILFDRPVRLREEARLVRVLRELRAATTRSRRAKRRTT